MVTALMGLAVPAVVDEVLCLCCVTSMLTDSKFVDDVSEFNDLNGHSVLTFDEFVKEGQADKFMCLAVASPISQKKTIS